MIKKLTLFLFIVIPVLSFSQEITREKIRGKITAPLGDDVEGVNIYNISSQMGTISNKEGRFEISVAQNDRIQISALQFQSFTVIVDEGVIDSGKMDIYLNPAVNQLEEVIVRPYDLSGNIIADVNRISTSVFSPEWDLSYETLEFDYEFSQDYQSSIKRSAAEDAYYNGQQQIGGDIIGLVGMFFKKKKKPKTPEKLDETEIVSRALRQRFSNAYIATTFSIPIHRVNDFLYFVDDMGVSPELLKGENEMELLERLNGLSIAYLESLKER